MGQKIAPNPLGELSVEVGASTGFEPVASALALQCSPSWAMKTHTLEAGQFIEFINPWKEWNKNGTKNSSKSAWRTFSCVKLEILGCRDAELWLNLDEARTTNRKHMTTELTAAVAQRPAGSKTEQMLQETRKESPENGFVARHCASSKGFEPVASALALQCSSSWAMKTHTLEADQFIEFINPWKEWNTEWNDIELREYKWNEYVTIAVNRNLSNCENSPKKRFSGLQRIRTRGLCVSAAVLSQLSYEDPYTGGWPIYWVHQPVKGMKHWMKWYWTAGIQMEWVCDHRSESQFKCYHL